MFGDSSIIARLFEPQKNLLNSCRVKNLTVLV